MPIYEYQCRQCDRAFEALIDAGDVAQCPSCDATDLERLLSLPARPTETSASFKSACSAGPDVPPCGPACARWPA